MNDEVKKIAKAVLISTDGEVTDIELDISTNSGLESFQTIVGGPIEMVRTPEFFSEDTVAILHEEGKLEDLPVNLTATLLLASVLFADDHIVGPLILTGVGGDGETVDCSVTANEVKARLIAAV